MFESMIFLLPRVGYVSFVEGTSKMMGFLYHRVISATAPAYDNARRCILFDSLDDQEDSLLELQPSILGVLLGIGGKTSPLYEMKCNQILEVQLIKVCQVLLGAVLISTVHAWL